MLLKLNWFRFGKSKDDSLKSIEKTKPEDETSVTQQMGFIKLFEEELKTSRKDYELACILSFCGLLVFIASICVVYYFSFVSPHKKQLELFTILISPVFMLIVFFDGFLRMEMQEVSSSYVYLYNSIKDLPCGPHNPELTKRLNQMKCFMQKFSNWQNAKDFILMLFHFLVYIGLLAWEVHIASTRTFRCADALLNVVFIGMAALPIGMSLLLPLKNFIFLYKAKKLSERYTVYSTV